MNQPKEPTEIWVDNQDLRTVVASEWVHNASIWQHRVNDGFKRYLSETYHNQLIQEKDKEIERLKNVNKNLVHHLKVMLASSDGALDAFRQEYGKNYPEDECSIKAKEYLKTINHE
ncbi:MAG TPA: hypothetical protein VGF79_00965 [Bacteroidia bacterium]